MLAHKNVITRLYTKGARVVEKDKHNNEHLECILKGTDGVSPQTAVLCLYFAQTLTVLTSVAMKHEVAIRH